MSAKGKLFIGAGILLFISLIAWVVRTIPDPPQPVEPKNEPRIMTYEGNFLSAEKDGRTQWELTADHIIVNVDTQDAEITNITVKFYEEDGRIVTLVADKGNYVRSTQDISVEGNVKVSNTDGAELTSQKFQWIAEKEMLVAEGEVHVKKDDMRATGNRIESTDGFNHIKIIGKAHLEKGAKKDGHE